MIRIKIFYLFFMILIICGMIDYIKALQCRIEESPADYEMKKVIRKCMRKIGSDNQKNFNNFNNHNYYQNNRDFNDDFSGSSNSNSDEQDNSNRLKNREHLQMRITNRNKRFTNNEQKRQQQQEQNDRRNGNGNGNGNDRNQRNNNNNNNGYQRNGNNNGTEMMDRSYENDTNCIVHCFFKEMNMLNHDDYPDKYKVLHILTKDVRENDLREFYTDSIQECFHFLEMEKRKDKCIYSASLINCMTDYARANCDDWRDHTVVFN